MTSVSSDHAPTTNNNNKSTNNIMTTIETEKSQENIKEKNDNIKVDALIHNLKNEEKGGGGGIQQIILEALNLFTVHWYTKQKEIIANLILQRQASSTTTSQESAKVLHMLKGFGIDVEKYRNINQPNIDKLKQNIDVFFQLKCIDIINKIQNTESFLWTETMHESDIAVLECIAIASINLDNEDLASITRMILKNHEIWKEHFNGEGFIGYIRHLSKDPTKRRHQSKLLIPIQNLLKSMATDISNDNINTSKINVSEHTANFILLSKLLQKCLVQIRKRSKWLTSDGENAYKTPEVVNMFKVINTVYMSLPYNDPGSSISHETFYSVLLRRCTLVNLWLGLTTKTNKE